VAKSEARLDAVWKTAAQDLAREVQTPRAKGGHLPVDTSFLRNSFAAKNGGVPRGRSDKPADYTNKDYDFAPISIVLTRAKIGDRIVFGYTANYAVYMEARYSFVRLAAQNWTQIVNKAARKVRRSVSRAN
jgi:hypothetical protein